MTKIKTINDVKEYAAKLVGEGTSFHPDNDFNEYIILESGVSAYNKEEAGLRNRLMDECFTICEAEGKDIYQIMLEVYLQETGLNNVIGAKN